MRKGVSKTYERPANPGFVKTMQQLRSSNAAGAHANPEKDPKAQRRKDHLKERKYESA